MQTTNNLTTFIYENSNIRSLLIKDQPWFIGKDLADALGYQNSSRDINRHVDKEDRQNYRNGTFETPRGMTIINESGMYSLILSSKLEGAKKFKRWVTNEVLPSIRKTGGYKLANLPKYTVEERAKMIEARERNSKARIANSYLKIAKLVEVPTYKELMLAYASKALNGNDLLPLPSAPTRKLYTATEIGSLLGVSAHKVGLLTNGHNLKIEQYGEWIWDKSRYSTKQVKNFLYYDNVIPVIEKLMVSGGR